MLKNPREKLPRILTTAEIYCDRKKRELKGVWADSANWFLNQMLYELERRALLLRSQEDIECFNAIVLSVKVVGELLIDYKALTESND